VLAAAAAAHPQPKIVSPAFYSRQMGWIGTGSSTAGKTATQLFYENGGYATGHWPGSGPKEW
jgi:hypothetical protein